MLWKQRVVAIVIKNHSGQLEQIDCTFGPWEIDDFSTFFHKAVKKSKKHETYFQRLGVQNSLKNTKKQEPVVFHLILQLITKKNTLKFVILFWNFTKYFVGISKFHFSGKIVTLMCTRSQWRPNLPRDQPRVDRALWKRTSGDKYEPSSSARSVVSPRGPNVLVDLVDSRKKSSSFAQS